MDLAALLLMLLVPSRPALLHPKCLAALLSSTVELCLVSPGRNRAPPRAPCSGRFPGRRTLGETTAVRVSLATQPGTRHRYIFSPPSPRRSRALFSAVLSQDVRSTSHSRPESEGRISVHFPTITTGFGAATSNWPILLVQTRQTAGCCSISSRKSREAPPALERASDHPNAMKTNNFDSGKVVTCVLNKLDAIIF